jgi:hypothetical protein
VPIEPLAVPIVSPPLLEEDADWLAGGEVLAADELELCELLPHAATSSDAPTATGMRNLLNETM